MNKIIHNFICNITIVLGCISMLFMSLDIITNIHTQPFAITLVGIGLLILGGVCLLAIPHCKE